jgi:hypothetical protein
MAESGGILSRRLRVIGWVCAAGIALMIFDLVMLLQSLPTEWWTEERVVEAAGGGISLRIMWADLGLAWIGQWGYLASLIWVPTAIVRMVRRSRTGAVLLPAERILFVVLCSLLAIITALVHLTPLRYPHYNFIVI